MLSNLPPGVIDSMLPGSRPEDREIEMILIFTQGDIEGLRQYNKVQMELPITARHELWATISNIVEQFN